MERYLYLKNKKIKPLREVRKLFHFFKLSFYNAVHSKIPDKMKDLLF